MKRIFLFFLTLSTLLVNCPAARHPYYHFKQLSIREGLPSSVTSLYNDRNGLLWIGTGQGLYRFNGHEIQKIPLPASVSRNSPYISELYGDPCNRLWIITPQGLCYYEPSKDSIQVLTLGGRGVKASTLIEQDNELLLPANDTLTILSATDLRLLRSVPLGRKGLQLLQAIPYGRDSYLTVDLWRKAFVLNPQTGELTAPPFAPADNVYRLFRDSHHRYWVSYYGQGVKCFDAEGRLLDEYHTRNSGLSNDIVLDITDWNNALWLATDGGGVNIVYPDTREVQVLSSHTDRLFPANSVTGFHPGDNQIWISTVREGILSAEPGFITTYTKAGGNPATGLSNKCPLCLWEDTDGNIWIGTDGGGLNRFNPQTEQFTHYPQTYDEKIVSICPLNTDELLVSSFSKGLFRFHKRTGEFRAFRLPDPEAERRLITYGAPVNLRVNSHHEIELYGSDFYRYLPNEHRMLPIRPNIPGLQASWVYIGDFRSHPLFCDRSRIFQYNEETDTYEPVTHHKGDQILAATVGRDGTLWVSDANGVSRILLASGHKDTIALPDANSMITSLVIDPEGTVWMGALGIIYAYDPHHKTFMIYNEIDGVLPNDFLFKPVLSARDGSVYMGGTGGLLRVNRSLRTATTPPPLRLTLQETTLNGMPVSQSERKDDEGLKINPGFSSLKIRVGQEGGNVFRKRFYRFHIKGLSPYYIETSEPQFTLYAAPPGSYNLTVQCTQSDGSWSPEFTLLHFNVLPPRWLRTPFLFAYAALAILAAVGVVYTYNRRLKHQYMERERKAYKEKVQTLINISHELRTPLTLIYSPLKQLAGNHEVPYTLRTRIAAVAAQARRMKTQIDMILNLRRMEVEKNILHMSEAALNPWLQGILDEFTEEFNLRGTRLEFEPDTSIETLYFDTGQCEIILSNLLTNACKFGGKNSTVTVFTQLERKGTRVRVTVKDEGPGIRPEEREQLFTRFFHGNHTLQGSGIGLSYAKQLVEMHGGAIGEQNNTDGPGASFWFTLPYRREAAQIQSVPQDYLSTPQSATPKKGSMEKSSKHKNEYKAEETVHTEKITARWKPDTLETMGKTPNEACERFESILIVEDDSDLCDYLVCNLQALFHKVYSAHDGREALPLLSSHLPQLVLTDLKMPRMNGLELCHYIKQKPELSYMPVVMLTACTEESTIQESYRTGAEAYITKPFDMETLTTQLRTIMKNHAAMKKHYAVAGPLRTQEPQSTANEQLALQFYRIVNENIGNADMDANFIAQQIGMSRASLYSKMKEDLGMGISEYILKCRLDYASRLLNKGTMSINEVSERSGFKHPRNFSTLFKSAFGKSPTEYKKEAQQTLTDGQQ